MDTLSIHYRYTIYTVRYILILILILILTLNLRLRENLILKKSHRKRGSRGET